MQERHPIKLTAKLVEQEDETWQATIVVGIESWLGAGEREVPVGQLHDMIVGSFATREAALARVVEHVAQQLAAGGVL